WWEGGPEGAGEVEPQALSGWGAPNPGAAALTLPSRGRKRWRRNSSPLVRAPQGRAALANTLSHAEIGGPEQAVMAAGAAALDHHANARPQIGQQGETVARRIEPVAQGLLEAGLAGGDVFPDRAVIAGQGGAGAQVLAGPEFVRHLVVGNHGARLVAGHLRQHRAQHQRIAAVLAPHVVDGGEHFGRRDLGGGGYGGGQFGPAGGEARGGAQHQKTATGKIAHRGTAFKPAQRAKIGR